MPTPVQTMWDTLEGCGWRPQGPISKFRALCPAHNDTANPSLIVSERDDGSVGVHCLRGCDTTDVVAAIGLRMRDLFPDRPAGAPSRPRKHRRRDKRVLPVDRVLDRLGGRHRATATPGFWVAVCRVCDGELWVHADLDEHGIPTGAVTVSCENGCVRNARPRR
jgi:hypothetical protein